MPADAPERGPVQVGADATVVITVHAADAAEAHEIAEDALAGEETTLELASGADVLLMIDDVDDPDTIAELNTLPGNGTER